MISVSTFWGLRSTDSALDALAPTGEHGLLTQRALKTASRAPSMPAARREQPDQAPAEPTDLRTISMASSSDCS
jgi:hypothetical protein